MTEKQIIDRLDSINLSLRQKKDLIGIIKDIANNSSGNGGGGTSTDKDALYIDIDYNNQVLTINDKKFIIKSNENLGAVVNNKELYSILYNSLFNAGKPVFIKAHFDIMHIFGQCAYYIGNNNIMLSMFLGDAMLVVKVDNQ